MRLMITGPGARKRRVRVGIQASLGLWASLNWLRLQEAFFYLEILGSRPSPRPSKLLKEWKEPESRKSNECPHQFSLLSGGGQDILPLPLQEAASLASFLWALQSPLLPARALETASGYPLSCQVRPDRGGNVGAASETPIPILFLQPGIKVDLGFEPGFAHH